MEWVSDQLCSSVKLSPRVMGLMTSNPSTAIATIHNSSVNQCNGNSLIA